MGIMMQAFYWNCPQAEGKDGEWWNVVADRVDGLGKAGFTALWLPPASKAANLGGPSMGYDPYDYYDLGDFQQKGRLKTWFGNQAELKALITAAHAARMQVYADFVPNHNSGADSQEVNLIDGVSRWTRFVPASDKFARDWTCFHPSPYETFDGMTFGEMPDLCHRNPYVYTSMMDLAQWMVEEIGFDGFRFDFVKGYGPWLLKAMAELRYVGPDRKGFKAFCVGECWDNARTIQDWLAVANAFTDNPISAFDFPLRYRLKDLCDTFGFDLRQLAANGALFRDQPERAVTFVDNHDTTQDPKHAVIRDKMMAYSFILTHEGYPCVFWLDYYNHGLERAGTPNGIAALVSAHAQLAGGGTEVLHAGQSLYAMQRTGAADQPGLVYVLNNRGDGWGGAKLRTRFRSARLTPVAWDGLDQSTPQPKWTDASGQADLWAPPRGYCVYAPR
jgi:alpha-amylase